MLSGVWCIHDNRLWQLHGNLAIQVKADSTLREHSDVTNVNSFKARLDRFWINQHIEYDFT